MTGGIGIDVQSAYSSRSVPPDTVEPILEDLLEHDLSCAPHVVARLVSEVTADAVTVRQVAATLDDAQRQGLRPLPEPLPAVPAIDALYAGVELDSRDRELLIAESLCLSDRLEPLLAFDGRSAEELAGSAIAERLRIHAGTIRPVDPRLRIWVRAGAGDPLEACVHERLSRVFHERGERVDADWHRARSSLCGDPATASELTRIARELSEAGFSDRALRLASEAAAHATGIGRDEAKVVTGVSAAAAGYAAEAAAWLASLFPDGAERYRLQGLGGLLIAQAHLQGAVPGVAPASFRPRTDDPEDWYAWARASGFAAVLCAERDDRDGMRAWLGALQEASAKVGAERDLRDPVVSLSWLIAGERDLDDVAGTGPLSGDLRRALHAAVDGDVDRGLRLLAVGDSGMAADADPFVAGFERSRLVGAYRAVVEVLLLMWRGDIGTARARMQQAAVELPITVPFSGLGVVLARRLDLAVLGRLGPFARSLTCALPRSTRIDRLVDRGIRSYLAGSFDEASATLRVWLDRGAPQSTLSVPGLDEAVLLPDGSAPLRLGLGPPEIASAHRLRARIAAASEARWRTERSSVVAAVRALKSPFTRARVETMLGVRALITEDAATGRAHLSTAQNLFEVSGATAWARAVAARLARLDSGQGRAPASADPLASCRRAWEPRVTPRELEVAMRVVAGASNRDIAAELNVSIRTVEVHLGRVFAKLEVKTRVELTVLAHRIGQHL